MPKRHWPGRTATAADQATGSVNLSFTATNACGTSAYSTAATLTVSNFNAANTYKWYRNDTLFYTNQLGNVAVGLPGLYRVVVNDGFCNSLTSNNLTISLLNIPRYTFSTKSDACINVPVEIITSAKEQSKIHFKWMFGDGSIANVANPVSHKYMSAGIYKINLQVSNDWCPKYFYQITGSPINVIAPLYGKNYTLYLYPNLDTLLVSKFDKRYTSKLYNIIANLSNWSFRINCE